jgi:hypothetical protein
MLEILNQFLCAVAPLGRQGYRHVIGAKNGDTCDAARNTQQPEPKKAWLSMQ